MKKKYLSLAACLGLDDKCFFLVFGELVFELVDVGREQPGLRKEIVVLGELLFKFHEIPCK